MGRVWILVLSLLGSVSANQVITLWGTGHGTRGSDKVACDTLHTEMQDFALKSRDFIYLTEPNLINPHNPPWDLHFKSVENVFVREYIDLFYAASNVLYLLQSFRNDPRSINIKTLKAGLNNFLSTYFVYPKNVKSLKSIKDISSKIKMDVDLLTKNIKNAPQSKLVSLVLDIKSGKHISDEAFYSYLYAWVDLVEKIGKNHFKRFLKEKSEMNPIVLDPKSHMFGQNIFELMHPDRIFSHKILMGNPLDVVLDFSVIYWRDYYSAKKIIEEARARPNEDILVWVGGVHVSGIIKNILRETKKGDSLLSRIQVFNQQQDPEACVLEAIQFHIQTMDPKRTIQKWYEKNETQETFVHMFTLKGKKMGDRFRFSKNTSIEDVKLAMKINVIKKNSKFKENRIYIAQRVDALGRVLETWKIFK